MMEVLSQATKGKFKILICIGDYGIVKKDVVFNFIFSGEGTIEESLGQCRPAAIASIKAETELKESKQQDFHPWTVYTASSNCPQEIHIVLPRWQPGLSDGQDIATRFGRAVSLAIENFF